MINPSESEIKKILDVAVNAPSGDNSQPWRFKVRDNVCEVYLIPKIDQTVYNFNEYGSYIAHGALIENINIEATRYSLGLNIEILPNANKELTSRITFTKLDSIGEDDLAKVIPLRHTNRKPYKADTISDLEIEDIIANAALISGPKLVLKKAPESKDIFLRALSVNDEIMFSNRKVHDTLFNIINWTEEEDAKSVRGLFVKTMELNNEQILAFRQLQNWSIMSKLARIGIPQLIAATNRKLYAATSQFGAITISSLREDKFIAAGRVIERIWLTANSKGISLHPVAGITYLSLFLENTNNDIFTELESKKILEADKEIKNFFGLSEQSMVFLFRLGRGQPATAKSKKLAPVYIN